MYRMNIQKGLQANGGPDMDLLGYIQHKEAGSFAYHLVPFVDAKVFKARTDAQGSVWIIVGAESTFEVPAELLIAGVKAEFTSGTSLARRDEASPSRAPLGAQDARRSAKARYAADGRRPAGVSAAGLHLEH